MNKIVDSQAFGMKIAGLLGLPKNVVSFELKAAAGKPVVVRCEYYPEDSDGFVTVLDEYELVPRERIKTTMTL